MFSVNGFTPDDLAYSVAVGEEVRTDPLARGVVLGPPHVMALLLVNEGRTLAVTPTGPFMALDLNRPDTVLGALYVLTTVVSIEGEVPEVIPEAEEGLIY